MKINKEDIRALLRRLNPDKPASSSEETIPRIERDRNSLSLLLTQLEADPYTKALVAGHIGVGKSTELMYLADRLRDDYFVMFQSVSTVLGAHNASVPRLLMFLLYQAVRQWNAKLDNIPIPKGLIDNIASIFGYLKTDDPELSAALDAGWTGPYVFDNSKQMEHFLEKTLRRISFRFPRSKEEPHINITDLGIAVEGFLKEMAAAAGKPLLVIVDDLDKMTDEDMLLGLFVNQSMAWVHLPCAIVATLPVNMYFHERVREIELIWGDISVLDPLDVPSPDYNTDDPALKFYVSLLEKVEGNKYFSERQVHTLARDSGGIARDFVQLCKTLLVLALNRGSSSISDWLVKAVEAHRTEKFRSRLLDEDYERLDEADKKQQIGQPAAQLLRDGVLICTRDDEEKRLFQPHPLVKELLRIFRFRRSMAAGPAEE